ncbi:MAG: RNA 2',3'-cyclic phosphodiesterase [Candidatus Omnitrophota bacterium]|nr:MAG: RNA 2',3'-cyclic phosphodiesterase [Candidatus Omnitrophota bacterium]
MQTIRSFIALELTSKVQKQLGNIQEELKKSDADVKWVNPEGIHLTLKFLGNVSPQLLEEIKKALTQLAKSHKSFELKISQIGAFPTTEHPRVIWVGIEEGREETLKLAQDLEERLIKFGFLKEKRAFKAHLTLGRVRSARNRAQLKKLLQSLSFPKTAMQAETLILFKSTLSPKGATYQALHQVKLS